MFDATLLVPKEIGPLITFNALKFTLRKSNRTYIDFDTKIHKRNLNTEMVLN